MSAKPSAKEESWRQEIVLAQQGNRGKRDQLVTQNMGLVYMVAKRFANRGADEEELVQIGAIGLIKAIDHFDVSLPYTFSTYAVPRIIGEIRRFLRDDGMIHISRSVKENARKIAIIREQMKKIENREPTMEELRQKTGLAEEELLLAMEASQEVESISKPIRREDGNVHTMEELLAAPEPFEVSLLERMSVRQVLEELDETERTLIRLRYLLGLSQAETARSLGTNQVAVSRLERRILGKLRRRLD